MQVSPLTGPSMVPVHILTAKAEEAVHAHIQTPLALLEFNKRSFDLAFMIQFESQSSQEKVRVNKQRIIRNNINNINPYTSMMV